MAIHYKLLIFFIIIVFVSSCCYKKDCDWETNQEIIFKLNEDIAKGGFTELEKDGLKYKIVNPITALVEDSNWLWTRLNTEQNSTENIGFYGFAENTDKGGFGSLKNKNLIIYLPGTSYVDTVFGIDFSFVSDKRSCNTCVLNGPDYTEVFTLTNRKATYRGKEFTESEFPVTITKK